ncbi:MAG: hypothetical protein H7257_15215, partial [Taibaiella sp.]|nr:hypothetical protein [Taibaiella sp.]
MIKTKQGSFVGGGRGNNATGDYGTVAGGQGNAANKNAFVGGGIGNVASAGFGAIAGGQN